jgi:hypothetical protein
MVHSLRVKIYSRIYALVIKLMTPILLEMMFCEYVCRYKVRLCQLQVVLFHTMWHIGRYFCFSTHTKCWHEGALISSNVIYLFLLQWGYPFFKNNVKIVHTYCTVSELQFTNLILIYKHMKMKMKINNCIEVHNDLQRTSFVKELFQSSA